MEIETIATDFGQRLNVRLEARPLFFFRPRYPDPSPALMRLECPPGR